MATDDPDMQTRRIRLRQWIDDHATDVKAFAAKHGLFQSELSDLLGKRSFGPRRARRLEQQVGMPSYYLDPARSPNPLPEREPVWPFDSASYQDYLKLSPAKRRELNIRVGEFIAGASPAPRRRSKGSPSTTE